MKIEINDVLFWMDAIRNSNDNYRVLESFWKGQINSKIWLIKNLEKNVAEKKYSIVIYGGWFGVLATLLFNSDIEVEKILSVDKDPVCKDICYTINKNYEIEGRFKAETADMANYYCKSDIAINTSCEHISQTTYDKWLANISEDTIIVLQSNNFYSCSEHIRCASNLENFIDMSNIKPSFSGVLETEKYDRFMIIGKKI